LTIRRAADICVAKYNDFAAYAKQGLNVTWQLMNRIRKNYASAL
jgi:hypothetical protein